MADEVKRGWGGAVWKTNTPNDEKKTGTSKPSKIENTWGKPHSNPIQKADCEVRITMPDKIVTEEDLHQAKKGCMQAAQQGRPALIGKYDLAEYKYLSELYNIYVRLTRGDITNEEGVAEEHRIRTAYDWDKHQQEMHTQFIREWNNAIKLSELNRSAMNKASKKDDWTEVLSLALQTVSALTRDTTVMSVLHAKAFDRTKDGQYIPKYAVVPVEPETEKTGDDNGQ